MLVRHASTENSQETVEEVPWAAAVSCGYLLLNKAYLSDVQDSLITFLHKNDRCRCFALACGLRTPLEVASGVSGKRLRVLATHDVLDCMVYD